MNKKVLIFISIIPIVSILVISIISNRYFEIISSASAVLFWIIQLIISQDRDKDENTENKLYKLSGFLLLIPSLGMVSGGLLFLFIQPEQISMKLFIIYMALSASLSALLIIQFFLEIKNKLLFGRVKRFLIIASLSSPLSIFIVLILFFTNVDDVITMSCMTTLIFGCMALLISINLIIVSFCEFKSTRESIRVISNYIKSKKRIFNHITIFKDAFLVLFKSGISIASVSFFMFVNALYSAGMGIARFIAVKMHKQDLKTQIKSYRYVGIIILASSFCYVLYSIRLFFGGSTGNYSMYIALIIAVYTFVEFSINIREAIRLRKSKSLEAKALRAISLSSTLLCFVLTQTAIMSFASEDNNSFHNAIAGLVFGGLAALVGLYIIVNSNAQKHLETSEEKFS